MSETSTDQTDPKKRVRLEQRLESALQNANQSSHRRFQDWQHLAPSPSKPDEWEFAFEVLSTEEAITAFFAQYDLNPKNPFDWRAIVDALASANARKHKWTRQQKVILAVDLCDYRATTATWTARGAAEAMRSLQRYQHIDIERMIDLVYEQDRICHFGDDSYAIHAVEHYQDDYVNEKIRRSEGGVLPWEAETWRWA